MKKIMIFFVLSLLLVPLGCSFYDLGQFIGKTAAMPVEATWDVTTGVLNGFFYGDYDGSDDTSTKKTSKEKTPVNRELKDYQRDEYGNIVW